MSALAFAGVVAATPFWRGNGVLAGSLLLSLAVLPLQGALLLRHAAGARAEAERANRAKTLRMASVGHELRTPLTAIVDLAGLLENNRLDAEQRDMTHTLAQAAQGLLGQIDHLVADARDEIETDADSVRDEIFDLFALAISTRAVLAVAAEAKGVAVGLMIEARTPRHIRGDPRRVREILQNVAGNAVKFTGAGACGAVAIRLGARRRDDGLWLEVEVSDTGPGIAPEARAQFSNLSGRAMRPSAQNSGARASASPSSATAWTRWAARSRWTAASVRARSSACAGRWSPPRRWTSRKLWLRAGLPARDRRLRPAGGGRGVSLRRRGLLVRFACDGARRWWRTWRASFARGDVASALRRQAHALESMACKRSRGRLRRW